MISEHNNDYDSPESYTMKIVQKSGTSFYNTMRLLDVDRRKAMYSVYSFCRAVDDMADGPYDTGEKMKGLVHWRKEINRVFHGSPGTLIGRALVRTVDRYGLDENNFIAIINGMEIDAAGNVRMGTMQDLEKYVDSVACAVGRLCTPIFGIASEPGCHLAKLLGEALQFTNILRDIDEDAARNRLYIPLSKLGNFDASNAVLISESLQFISVCEEFSHIAFDRFKAASILISNLDKHSVRAPRLMLEMHRRLLGKMAAKGWHLPRSRIYLSWPEKAWITLKHGWF